MPLVNFWAKVAHSAMGSIAVVLSKTIASCLLISSVLFTAPALALTFKKGQVLGADGGVYDGASPDQRDAIISNSKREGLSGCRWQSR